MNAPVILHVEDDPNDRLILSILFKKAAPEVDLRAVCDGVEASEYLSGRGAYGDRSRHPLPGLLLVDLKLPRMTGFELLAWARAEPALAGLPIVVLSSSQEQGDVVRAYELGASSYLVKSIDLPSMERLVRGLAELLKQSARR